MMGRLALHGRVGLPHSCHTKPNLISASGTTVKDNHELVAGTTRGKLQNGPPMARFSSYWADGFAGHELFPRVMHAANFATRIR